MKCSNCGAELRLGCMYCEACGEPAQIVPDYNLLEDEFLETILDENKKKNLQEANAKQSKNEEINCNRKKTAKKNQEAGKRVRIAIIIGIIVSLIAIVGLVLFFNSYGYFVNRGLSLDKKENYKTAVMFYERAVDKDDTKAKAFILAANDYVRLEEYEKAEDYYFAALSIEENNLQAYKGLIDLYLLKGDYIALDRLQENVTNRKVLDLFEKSLVTPPVFSENGGKFTDDVILTIESQDGLTIFYTDDGSDPTGKKAKKYEGEIKLSEGKTTISAVCKNEDGTYSQTITNTYNISYETPDMPEVNPAGGTFHEPTMISVVVPEGASVYYTWDGTEPNTGSTLYTGPIEMPEGNHVLSLVLIDKHGNSSEILQCKYKYYP